MHFILGLVLAALLCAGCIRDTDPGASSPESATEMAISVIGGAVVISEDPTGLNFAYLPPTNTPRLFRLLDGVLIREALASATCPAFNTTSCSAGLLGASLNNCSFNSLNGLTPPTWNALFRFSFYDGTGALVCPSTWSGAGLQGTDSSVLRAVSSLDGTGAAKKNYPSGIFVAAGTKISTTYDPALVLGVGVPGSLVKTNAIVTNYPSSNPSQRSIFIGGMEMAAAKNYFMSDGVSPRTAVVWDYTVIANSSPLTLTVSGNSRTVSGQLLTTHNLSKYTATITLPTDPSKIVTWDLAPATGCGCFPVAGQVSTALSGGFGSETLTFTKQSVPSGFTATGTCGTATYTRTPASGPAVTTNIVLSHCF